MKAKKVYKLIAIFIACVITGFVIWIGYVYYIFSTWIDEIWTEENRIMIGEYFSPDSTKKIGLYQYDSGALGYTAIQMSIVDRDGTYPIGGNILQINRIPPHVNWISDDSVFVVLDTSNTPGFKIDKYWITDNIKFEFSIINEAN